MTEKTNIKVLVLNGPNLDLLGTREPDVYGSETLADIEQLLKDHASVVGPSKGATIELDFRQSNSEADIISWIGETTGKFDGIIINPAALTHTSVGVLDAIRAVGGSGETAVPCVEVHLSNTQSREDFRHKSLTAPGCIGQIMGFQSQSYVLALDGLLDFVLNSRSR